jgi:twinkle protein
MRKWYKGKIQVYCNEEDSTSKSILKKMEELAKRYGTKVFIIDNLMMIDLQAGDGDVLKKQKEFVLDLKKFARRYNSVVHLIAHPRKTQGIQRLTKLDVAGTGDITNLADYVLGIHRVLPSEKEDVQCGNKKGCPFDNIIDLFKNRPLGHQDKTIGLYFDIKSKRLYGESDDINKRFSWWKEDILDLVEVEDGEFPF